MKRNPTGSPRGSRLQQPRFVKAAKSKSNATVRPASRMTPAERRRILAAAKARGRRLRPKMAAEEGGTISTAAVAKVLGCAQEEVRCRYHSGQLLGFRFRRHGHLHFPVWQFSAGRLLPGFDAVLVILNQGTRLDDWGRLLFFLANHGYLDGRRPLDLLREGKQQLVVRCAVGYVE
jgi:hypothetical protein